MIKSKSIIKAKHLARRLLRGRNFYLEEFRKKKNEITQAYEVCLNDAFEVNQPLLLISQIQRSGGTLLSQLLDSHPECHHHPDELYIGSPKKWVWPNLDLQNNPEAWFKSLFEPHTLRHFRSGYQKYAHNIDGADTYPFIFLPNLQRMLFLKCVISTRIQTQREILDCYMTSYFNAWLNYRHSYSPKKYIVAFVPRVNFHPGSLDRFFTDYPDGKVIQMIREPKNWYVSAHRHESETYPDIETAIDLWKNSACAMLESRERFGERVHLLSYEELLEDPEPCMRRLSEFAGIEYNPLLLVPTFQGMPTCADSSFDEKTCGLIRTPLKRYHVLSQEDRDKIDRCSEDLYQTVLKKTSLSNQD